MNSTADIKAFCGRNGGVVCTSSNAEVALEWAFEQHGPDAKVLFLPDQHLGRNTAVLKMGSPSTTASSGTRYRPGGGLTAEQLRDAKMILWKGHCSVHGRFSAEVVDELRANDPRRHRSWCTPSASTRSCSRPTWSARRSSSSRPSRRRPPARAGRSAPSSTWSSGWPTAHPDKTDLVPRPTVCYCSTMNRIDLPHFVWAMESLVDGEVVNRIEVDPETEEQALVALQRMLDLPGKSHRD